ncbi:MAG: DUF1285 domain-containing protein [Deltaproteobacteria bacterium]|nr:DUF1285 domain-containing protein [Deltaproteobacteria bacterium]
MSEDAVPFKLSRESRIRVDRDGHIWHEGERVLHPGLERALASWIDLDDNGRYVMRNALDWCFVTVDHTPLVVRSVRLETDPSMRVEVELSDDSTEALDLSTVQVDPDGVVYAHVREGKLLARFDRQPSFKFLEHVDTDDRGLMTFVLGTKTVRIAPLERGETLVPPAPPLRPVTGRT